MVTEGDTGLLPAGDGDVHRRGGHGHAAMVDSMPTMMVTAEAVDPLLAEYDPDGDGVIEKADMRKAVAKFFAGPAELSRSDMRRLVGIYFG